MRWTTCASAGSCIVTLRAPTSWCSRHNHPRVDFTGMPPPVFIVGSPVCCRRHLVDRHMRWELLSALYSMAADIAPRLKEAKECSTNLFFAVSWNQEVDESFLRCFGVVTRLFLYCFHVVTLQKLFFVSLVAVCYLFVNAFLTLLRRYLMYSYSLILRKDTLL